jgi:O-antigen/teichoic acid export membrane protein
MSDLMSRGAILTISRMSNFAIHLISPVLLVRILDVQSYGQYQEFTIYAMLLIAIFTFSVDTSLTYFLPRFPNRELEFVVQTNIITIGLTAVGATGVIIAKPYLLSISSFDFVVPLAIYVLCFVNFGWLEYYWIAKKQPRLVMLYSGLRLIWRVGALIVSALATNDVRTIIWTLVVAEAIRLTVTALYCAHKKLLFAPISWAGIVEQLRFASPLGAAAVLQNTGRNIGKIFISSTLGPSALAFYAVGSYLLPIIRVLRSGISDAIYPDLVSAHDRKMAAVRLWQRVNVLNCVMFFPALVIVLYYSETIVSTVFTPAYVAAVPVFNVFAFFLIRRCFNTDVLLRITGRTGFMLWGTLGSLVLNVILIGPFARIFGLVGPALAFLTAELVLEAFYATRMSKSLGLGFSHIADWKCISKVAISCAVAFPVLLVINLIPGPELLLAAIASAVYFSLVVALSYRFGIEDIGKVAVFAWRRLGLR